MVRGSLRIVGVGTLAGLLGTVALTRALDKMLFAVSPNDPLTIFAAATAFLVVAAIASWLPARRAEKVEPMAALRDE